MLLLIWTEDVQEYISKPNVYMILLLQFDTNLSFFVIPFIFDNQGSYYTFFGNPSSNDVNYDNYLTYQHLNAENTFLK